VQNLLLATSELRHFVDDDAAVCCDVIQLSAEDGRTLVDMVTGCHDDALDAVSLSASLSPLHHQHQQQKQEQLTGSGDTPEKNFSPELFLNTCDENMTSSSSSSSSSSPVAVAAPVPLHCPLANGCAPVTS